MKLRSARRSTWGNASVFPHVRDWEMVGFRHSLSSLSRASIRLLMACNLGYQFVIPIAGYLHPRSYDPIAP